MKVGIVGCGLIAKQHMMHILRHKDIDTVAVADVRQNIATELAEKFGVKHVYTQFDDMQRELNLDVVHILTPPMTHAELAIKAMNSGCHVLVEKPMAITPRDADDMINAALENNVKLCVDHNYIFSPVMQKTLQLINRGAIGRILHLEALYNFDLDRIMPSYSSSGSKQHWAFSLPGGLISDHIPHPASLLLDLIPKVDSINKLVKSNGLLPNNQPDELRVLIDAGNFSAFLSVSFSIKPDCFIFNAYGTEMSLHANLTNLSLVSRKNRQVSKKFMRILDNIDHATQLYIGTLSSLFKVVTRNFQPPGDVGSLIKSFYKSIKNDEKPPVTGEDGKKVVNFIEEVWI
jgi:predicted dehydrogenase